MSLTLLWAGAVIHCIKLIFHCTFISKISSPDWLGPPFCSGMMSLTLLWDRAVTHCTKLIFHCTLTSKNSLPVDWLGPPCCSSPPLACSKKRPCTAHLSAFVCHRDKRRNDKKGSPDEASDGLTSHHKPSMQVTFSPPPTNCISLAQPSTLTPPGQHRIQ
jgi:hypothetical protein